VTRSLPLFSFLCLLKRWSLIERDVMKDLLLTGDVKCQVVCDFYFDFRDFFLM